MPVRFQTLPAPCAGVAALRLDGAVARGDHRHFAAAAGELLGADACAGGLVLELTDLHSISEELADEIALLRRRLAEGGAQVAVVGASVVVAWFLRRRLGGQPLRECTTVEEAVADLATVGAPSIDTVATGRDLPSLAAVAGFLEILGSDAPSAERTAALNGLLQRGGLGREAHLLRCDGDRLVLDGHLDALAEAGGRLGTLLAANDTPLSLHELRVADLSPREQNFLRWSGADVVVPLKAAGRLQGALLVRSGRDGGIFSYLPGEMLGLGLVGCLIAGRLALSTPVPTDGGSAEFRASDAEVVLSQV